MTEAKVVPEALLSAFEEEVRAKATPQAYLKDATVLSSGVGYRTIADIPVIPVASPGQRAVPEAGGVMRDFTELSRLMDEESVAQVAVKHAEAAHQAAGEILGAAEQVMLTARYAVQAEIQRLRTLGEAE